MAGNTLGDLLKAGQLDLLKQASSDNKTSEKKPAKANVTKPKEKSLSSTNTSKDNNDYKTFVDWGVNQISSYAPNTWRTLTSDEWTYIINWRSNASNLIGVAQVNGVNGLILLPDGWTCPDDVTFKSGVAEDSESFADYQSFSASQWSKLEASGAVFFPASGYHIGIEMKDLQQICCYWASDAIDEGFSFVLVCQSYWLNVEKGPKYLRQSVRLVKDN